MSERHWIVGHCVPETVVCALDRTAPFVVTAPRLCPLCGHVVRIVHHAPEVETEPPEYWKDYADDDAPPHEQQAVNTDTATTSRGNP